MNANIKFDSQSDPSNAIKSQFKTPSETVSLKKQKGTETKTIEALNVAELPKFHMNHTTLDNRRTIIGVGKAIPISISYNSLLLLYDFSSLFLQNKFMPKVKALLLQ